MTAADFKGLTWAVGSVRGVRAFGVDPLGRLHGVTYRKVWRPGENTATCEKDADDRDCIGAHSLLKCGCGFYAYNSKSSDYETGDRIAGVVEGYGKTVLTEKGFRASKARIVALYDPTAASTGEDADDPDGWRRGKPTHWGWFWIAVAALIYAAAAATICLLPLGSWSIAVGAVGGVLAGGLATWNLLAIGRAKDMATRHQTRLGASRYEVAKTDWLKRTNKPASSSLDPALVAKVRRNYPDVPWYTDRDQMLADFPPDVGPEPSPENAPDFWDRPVPEYHDSFSAYLTSLGGLSAQRLMIHPYGSGRRGVYL